MTLRSTERTIPGTRSQFGWLLLCVMLLIPVLGFGQGRRPWSKTIQLRDRRSNRQKPVVAKVTFKAYWMETRISPGQPIYALPNGNPEPVAFKDQKQGFVRFEMEDITWTDKKHSSAPQEYKVVVRSLWVDMKPKLYKKNKAKGRKDYINAPNIEYVAGDSTPPPIIYMVDRNGPYTFMIGCKTLTPETAEERRFDYKFDFRIEGLQAGEAPPDTIPVVEKPPEVTVDTVEGPDPDIIAAIKQAREQEDIERLKGYMRDYPDYDIVKEVRASLDIEIARELVDSVRYRLDFRYENYTRPIPKREELDLRWLVDGRELPRAYWPAFDWRNGKLFVAPPRDSVDYELEARLNFAPEKRKSITLNSMRDAIKFSYVVLEDQQAVRIKIERGNGPFLLNLEQKRGDDFFNVEGSMTVGRELTIPMTKLARAFNLREEGDFRMFVIDADQLKKTGKDLVHIVPPPPIPTEVWYATAGVLGLFLIGWLFWRREQKRKDAEMEKLLAERGGSDPRVKRKPNPKLKEFWRETAISDLSLHKNFIREISTYLKERGEHPKDINKIEGVIMGTVLKFDFENEQYEVRLDRFRAIQCRPLNFYEDKPNLERWPQIRQVTEDHRDLVKIGWLHVIEGGSMPLSKEELNFQDEQFSELFQLVLKIDISGEVKHCGFFTRTISGQVNNASDRRVGVSGWLDWDKLEDAGYYENEDKGIREEGEEAEGEARVKIKMRNETEAV